jgi:hypothetical protein
LEETTGLTGSGASVIILLGIVGKVTMDTPPSKALLIDGQALAHGRAAPDEFLVSVPKISPKQWNPHAQILSQASQYKSTNRQLPAIVDFCGVDLNFMLHLSLRQMVN